jgi:hypothetical protein
MLTALPGASRDTIEARAAGAVRQFAVVEPTTSARAAPVQNSAPKIDATIKSVYFILSILPQIDTMPGESISGKRPT